MFYVGLDVASEKHDCCILNEKKRILQSFSISNSSVGFDSLRVLTGSQRHALYDGFQLIAPTPNSPSASRWQSGRRH